MSKPEQTAEPKFPKLHDGMGKQSTGTVTGHNIDRTCTVHIVGKTSHKTWDGNVTGPAGGDTWNVTVTRTPHATDDEQARGVETVTVTVTNGSGTSGPADTQSDVVP